MASWKTHLNNVSGIPISTHFELCLRIPHTNFALTNFLFSRTLFLVYPHELWAMAVTPDLAFISCRQCQLACPSIMVKCSIGKDPALCLVNPHHFWEEGADPEAMVFSMLHYHKQFAVPNAIFAENKLTLCVAGSGCKWRKPCHDSF